MQRRGIVATMLFAVAIGAIAADSPLVEAVKNQDQQQIGVLLNQNPDVNVRSNDGSTALLWAAHWGDVKTTDLLLRAGADPNVANDFRMTPLSQACVNGSAGLVELLLKAGANPNTPIATGETPLMTCAKTGGVDAVKALIAHDATVNAKEPVQNQTALMWAAAERHPSVVNMLIDAKADLQARTKRGFTALHFAAREGDQESIRLLLAAGVSANILAQPDPPAKGKAEDATEPVPGGAAVGGGGGAAVARGGGRNAGAGGYTPLMVASIREPTRIFPMPVLRRCTGPCPPGKTALPIRYTVLKTPCPESRIAKPS
jgi:ankyrin repeat protein